MTNGIKYHRTQSYQSGPIANNVPGPSTQHSKEQSPSRRSSMQSAPPRALVPTCNVRSERKSQNAAFPDTPLGLDRATAMPGGTVKADYVLASGKSVPAGQEFQIQYQHWSVARYKLSVQSKDEDGTLEKFLRADGRAVQEQVNRGDMALPRVYISFAGTGQGASVQQLMFGNELGIHLSEEAQARFKDVWNHLTPDRLSLVTSTHEKSASQESIRKQVVETRQNVSSHRVATAAKPKTAMPAELSRPMRSLGTCKIGSHTFAMSIGADAVERYKSRAGGNEAYANFDSFLRAELHDLAQANPPAVTFRINDGDYDLAQAYRISGSKQRPQISNNTQALFKAMWKDAKVDLVSLPHELPALPGPVAPVVQKVMGKGYFNGLPLTIEFDSRAVARFKKQVGNDPTKANITSFLINDMCNMDNNNGQGPAAHITIDGLSGTMADVAVGSGADRLDFRKEFRLSRHVQTEFKKLWDAA